MDRITAAMPSLQVAGRVVPLVPVLGPVALLADSHFRDAAWTATKQAGKNLASNTLGLSFAPFTTVRDEYNPGAANQIDPAQEQQAKADLVTNAAAEARAVARLAPAARQQYDAVKRQVSTNPLATRALQAMLLDGRLPGPTSLRGNQTLLAVLAGLTTQPLAPGISRENLVAELVREVEEPVRINQFSKGTCGATTAQILLARKQPAELARIVAGLATPSGRVQMAGGEWLRRKPDWAADDGGRSLPGRLFQPAVMEAGEFPLTSYDNTKDKVKLGGVSLGDGLTSQGSAEINGQLQGRPYVDHLPTALDRGQIWQGLKDALARGGGPYPVSMTFPDTGHFVQVDRVVDGRVQFTNPWGVRQSMAESEFVAHLSGVQMPAGELRASGLNRLPSQVFNAAMAGATVEARGLARVRDVAVQQATAARDTTVLYARATAEVAGGYVQQGRRAAAATADVLVGAPVRAIGRWFSR